MSDPQETQKHYDRAEAIKIAAGITTAYAGAAIPGRGCKGIVEVFESIFDSTLKRIREETQVSPD